MEWKDIQEEFPPLGKDLLIRRTKISDKDKPDDYYYFIGQFVRPAHQWEHKYKESYIEYRVNEKNYDPSGWKNEYIDFDDRFLNQDYDCLNSLPKKQRSSVGFFPEDLK